MKGGIDLPPALTVFSQALMALLFGFLGLMCAVPLLAAIVVAVKMLYVEGVVGDQADLPAEDPRREIDTSARRTSRMHRTPTSSARRRFPGARRGAARRARHAFPRRCSRCATVSPYSGSSATISARIRSAATRSARSSFCSAAVKADDRIVTVGSAGSTHALAVATYAKRLGARVSLDAGGRR